MCSVNAVRVNGIAKNVTATQIKAFEAFQVQSTKVKKVKERLRASHKCRFELKKSDENNAVRFAFVSAVGARFQLT